jgi:hypothetical protein
MPPRPHLPLPRRGARSSRPARAGFSKSLLKGMVRVRTMSYISNLAQEASAVTGRHRHDARRPTTYPAFLCTIQRRGNGLLLEKHGGSQRVRGAVTSAGDGFAFTGVFYCPDGAQGEWPVRGSFQREASGSFAGELRGRGCGAEVDDHVVFTRRPAHEPAGHEPVQEPPGREAKTTCPKGTVSFPYGGCLQTCVPDSQGCSKDCSGGMECRDYFAGTVSGGHRTGPAIPHSGPPVFICVGLGCADPYVAPH